MQQLPKRAMVAIGAWFHGDCHLVCPWHLGTLRHHSWSAFGPSLESAPSHYESPWATSGLLAPGCWWKCRRSLWKCFAGLCAHASHHGSAIHEVHQQASTQSRPNPEAFSPCDLDRGRCRERDGLPSHSSTRRWIKSPDKAAGRRLQRRRLLLGLSWIPVDCIAGSVFFKDTHWKIGLPQVKVEPCAGPARIGQGTLRLGQPSSFRRGWWCSSSGSYFWHLLAEMVGAGEHTRKASLLVNEQPFTKKAMESAREVPYAGWYFKADTYQISKSSHSQESLTFTHFQYVRQRRSLDIACGVWLHAVTFRDVQSEAAERSNDQVQRPLPSIKSMWRLMLQPFQELAGLM